MLLLNASGCLDALTAPEVACAFDGFVTKTVTPEAREGNPPARIAETEHGMLNAIGLANPGRERFLAETLPALRNLGIPLWVSVGGFSAAEYAETCSCLEDVTIELNLSCPNVDEAPESAAEIVAHAGRRPNWRSTRSSLRMRGTSGRPCARSRWLERTASASSTRCAGSRYATTCAPCSSVAPAGTRARR